MPCWPGWPAAAADADADERRWEAFAAAAEIVDEARRRGCDGCMPPAFGLDDDDRRRPHAAAPSSSSSEEEEVELDDADERRRFRRGDGTSACTRTRRLGATGPVRLRWSCTGPSS